MVKFIYILAFCIIFSVNANAFSHNLNCNHPQTINEQIICINDDLRERNFEIAKLFKEHIKEKSDVVNSYKLYYLCRLNACEGINCINNVYNHAEKWVNDKMYMEQIKKIDKIACPIKDFNKDCEVYVYSSYNGSKQLNGVFISNEHETYLTELKINKPGKCIVAFSSSYEPVIWDIYTTPETNLKAVIVGAYYPKMIRDIDKTIQTINEDSRVSYKKDKSCLEGYTNAKG